MRPGWLQELPDPGPAREAAHRELEKQAYDEARPSWTYRAVHWAIDKVQELLGKAASAVPGGRLGVLLIVLLVGGLVAIAVVTLRPARRRIGGQQLFGATGPLTATEHRSKAESLALQGAYADAVRERLRAVVRGLEERGVLDPRPGRTASEISAEAARALPAITTPMRRAATTFEQIWYGGRPADAQAYALLVAVDDEVAGVRA